MNNSNPTTKTDIQTMHHECAPALIPHPDGSGEILTAEAHAEFLSRYYATKFVLSEKAALTNPMIAS